MPRGARVDRALGLLDRLLGDVEARERDQAPARARGELERAVVGGAEGGVAVGLVEAEDERARDAVLGLDPLELVVVAAEAVDVEAEVDVTSKTSAPSGSCCRSSSSYSAISPARARVRPPA